MLTRTLGLMAVALVTATVAPAIAAQRPMATPAVVPIYPGAQPYDPQSRQVVTTVRETLLELPEGVPLLSSSRETFVADVVVEKVAAFYRARLGGLASGFELWKAVDPRTLVPENATPVHHQSYWEGGATRYVYHWYRKAGNGDIQLTEVEFGTALSTDPRLANRVPLTMIVVTEKTFSRSAPSSAPDEKALGARIYPGALYDSNGSTNTLGVLWSHVFLTDDAIERVIAFYERECGRAAMKGAPLAGGVNWYFRPCSSGFPDDYILVQEVSGTTGSRKTMINFNLTREAPPDRT